MKNKKLIIAIVLCIAGILSLIYGLTVPTKGKRKTGSSAEILHSASAVMGEKKIVPKRRRAKKTEFTSWDRNPFVPKGTPGAFGGNFTLEGIMWNKENPEAMINNVIVRRGDNLSGYKVIEIRKDKVVLSDGTEDFILRLE